MNDFVILVSPLYVCLCPISQSTFDVWPFLWLSQTASRNYTELMRFVETGPGSLGPGLGLLETAALRSQTSTRFCLLTSPFNIPTLARLAVVRSPSTQTAVYKFFEKY